MRPKLSRLNATAAELADWLTQYDWASFAILVEMYDLDHPVELFERVLVVHKWREQHTTYTSEAKTIPAPQ